MITKIDGADINYEVFGQDGGIPVLLLHGWGVSIEAMTSIWRFLEGQKKYKIYVIDFPGESNKSSVPPKPWGVPEYGEMVKKFIEENKIEKTNVIAHSFGGRVTIYLASKYQELFDKIILTDAAGVKPKMTLKKFINRYKFKLGKFVLKTFTKKETRDKKLQEYRDKYSSADYKALNSDLMRETFKKVINLDLTPNLKDITRPTLLIWGENDIDTPLYMAKIMEKHIKDSGLVILKDAKHFSYVDKINEYNVIVDNFLSNN
jgi:pimeloyl-ACP methyl ester carboxylesterase